MFGFFGFNKAAAVADQSLDVRVPIDEVCYVVLDSELTGLDVNKDAIVSIGAVRMTGGRIHLGDTLELLVSPETGMTRASVLVHGITPSDVENRPAISSKALAELNQFSQGCVLVGHFLSLDLAILDRECRRLNVPPFRQAAVDTWRIQAWIENQTSSLARDFPDTTGNRDLFTLAAKYSIPVRKAHDALGDAFLTAQVFQRHLSALMPLGVRTVKDLLKIGKP